MSAGNGLEKALVSYDERALTERPMTFSSKHVDPLIWGVCTCEVCWYERCAKRQADAAERAAARAHEARKMDVRMTTAQRRREAYWTDEIAAFTATAVSGWSLWAFWALGNAVYVFLYHPH